MEILCGVIAVFLFGTQLLWVPLLCFCFYQAVRRYLSNAPYRMYLYASSVCLIALTSLPFWDMISSGKIALLYSGAQGFVGYLILCGLLLFWFWPYLFLTELLSVAKALQSGEKKWKPNFFLFLSLFALCFLQWFNTLLEPPI